MEDRKLLELIERFRVDKTSKFDNLKKHTNDDEGKEMITIYDKNLSVRKVNDWGRDEDTDFYLGLDSEGWITYVQVNHNLAGPFKIINEDITRVTDQYVLDYIKENNEAYEAFINKTKIYFE